jgi:hypothetical protein
MPVSEARRTLPDAIYLPPARQADLLSAVTTHNPEVIGLVDGVFGQSLSVWHKEILFALERGVAVLGSSSIGALRAAETSTYGMLGVGEVFAQFARGELTDDDEVALTHAGAELEFRGLSEPMVNIRATLAALQDQGVIDEALRAELLRLAKAAYFPERSYRRLLRDASEAGVAQDALDRVARALPTVSVDVKRRDAQLLLELIRDGRFERIGPSARTSLTRSHLFEALYNRDRTVSRLGVDLPLLSVANYAALHDPAFNDLNWNALNRELVGVLAEMLEVSATDNEVTEERRRFCRTRKLAGEADVTAWLEQNDLHPSELDGLVRSLAVCRKLQRWLITRKYLERTTRTVLDELRLRGAYPGTVEAAASMEQVLVSNFPDFQGESHADLSMPMLVTEHLQETECAMDTPFPEWAEEAGFKDVGDLRYELLRSRLARRFMASLTNELCVALRPPSGDGAA